MKIKLYIVTYDRTKDLNNTLQSLFEADNISEIEVYIINNHSNFYINDCFKEKVKIIHNSTRPDFSTGHLSRNYNEIIMDGFKDLENPDCDILMHSHDDNFFEKDFLVNLIDLHKKYSFITFSQGCGFVSYTPDAIKKIGMWDERFCTIGYHEGDYMIRAIKYNFEKSSVNDFYHRRVHNPEKELVHKIPGTDVNESHKKSQLYYSICRQVFLKKWENFKDTTWQNDDIEKIKNILVPKIPTYMYYPYFEKNIKNLNEKYYDEFELNGEKFL